MGETMRIGRVSMTYTHTTVHAPKRSVILGLKYCPKSEKFIFIIDYPFLGSDDKEVRRFIVVPEKSTYIDGKNIEFIGLVDVPEIPWRRWIFMSNEQLVGIPPAGVVAVYEIIAADSKSTF